MKFHFHKNTEVTSVVLVTRYDPCDHNGAPLYSRLCNWQQQVTSWFWAARRPIVLSLTANWNLAISK